MTKIYLAKSNRANPDDVSRVRSFLLKYSNDIEVVEFKGGSYSHKDLKSCDILLIVPDLSNFDVEDNNYIDIGKGLHEQIFAFKHQHSNKCDTLVILGSDEDEISVTQVADMDLGDPDDYVNYSCIIIDDGASGTLESLVLNRFVSGEYDATQLSSKTEFMYLLIGQK